MAAYGREKSYAERVLDVFERDHRETRVVRLRPGFIFKASSSAQQRRLFAGPLVPGVVLRPGLVPLVPDMPGFRFQVLHSHDAAAAYHLALTRDVRGPFNVAADPVIDAASLGRLLRARPVRVPARVAGSLLAAAWRLHLVPASPHLFDLALSLPLMDSDRARTVLGWHPEHDAFDALSEVIEGMHQHEAGGTPPLRLRAQRPSRLDEVATGVGQRGGVTPDAR
jgi:nucleoside-diphosphate-sugar epimerase